MDYINPKEVAGAMMTAAINKSMLSVKDLLIRGALSGALLAISVTLANLATSQTTLSLIGAFVFPVGFVIIIILGLELVTGSFALVPLAWLEKKISALAMLKNLFWVFVGNLIGSVLFAVMFWAASSDTGQSTQLGGIEQLLVSASEKKTVGYGQHGGAGLFSAFIKAILCNWMVCMGVVMSMTSKSTLGKIFGCRHSYFYFLCAGI